MVRLTCEHLEQEIVLYLVRFDQNNINSRGVLYFSYYHQLMHCFSAANEESSMASSFPPAFHSSLARSPWQLVMLTCR